MAKHQQFRYLISAAVLAIAAVALLFSVRLSFWLLLLVAQPIAIYACVETLTQRMPASLRTQSQDNCYRLDGTLSSRRASRERKAVRKVRSDLWAAFLVVAFVGTSCVFLIETQVLPFRLGAEVVSALFDDPGDFKGALRQRHVDDKFFHWSRSTSTVSNANIDRQAQLLWISWPAILALVVASFVACVALIRYTYFRTLREFHVKVSARATEYLDLDTGRLQFDQADFRRFGK